MSSRSRGPGSLKDWAWSQDYRVFPNPPHLTTTSLKTDFQQFLLPSLLHLAIRRKITRHTKRPKTQLEETEQASEADMAGMLELSGWEFQTTMTHMLRAQTDKTDSMKNSRAMLTERWKS